MYMLCTGSGRSNSSDLNSACIFFDLRDASTPLLLFCADSP